MNTQETITALAAELTRINKLPQWIGSGPKNTWAIFEDGTNETVLREDAVLAALSGVAAELCANERITIVKTSRGYHPFHYLIGFFGYLPTIHEALIAALKQIKEVKK